MKKMTYFVMALAVVLGLAQCKKEQTNATNQTEGVRITLNVENNGSKHEVVPGTGVVNFQDNDVIYVGDGNTYIGTLSREDGVFSGTISEPVGDNPKLHFYFVGGLTPSATPDASTTSFTVNISNQSSKLPVLACNSVNYTGAGTYSCQLKNKCGLVKFVPETATSETVTIGGFYNTATINFATPGITSTGDPGDITLFAESDAAKWAILLPQEDVSATASISGYNCSIEGTIDIDNNDYNTTGVSIAMMPAGPTHYSSMPNGVVLHVGDSFIFPGDNIYPSDPNGAGIYLRSETTFTLLRGNVNIIQGEYPWENSVEIEESPEGTYYCFNQYVADWDQNSILGIDEMMGIYENAKGIVVFEATETSDGLYVTIDNDGRFAFSVHEP